MVEEAKLTAPAPAADPRKDRLKAVEDETGFKLCERVMVAGTNHGVLSVVGFAQVNIDGIDGPIRSVCVADPQHLKQHGMETVILFTPDRLRHLPTPVQPN